MQRDSLGKWVMIVALVLILGAGGALLLSLNSHKVAVTIGDRLVYAQVAHDDASRQKGLSGTSSLADNQAMLFVFDGSGRWGMWMKDMNYSIDIVWLDGGKKVVYVQQNVAPSTYPKAFLPDRDAQYVLELPAGFTQQHSVGIGQIVSFTVN